MTAPKRPPKTAKVLKAGDVAAMLGVHRNTVMRLPLTDLRYFTVSARGDRRYLSTDVEAYIAARMR